MVGTRLTAMRLCQCCVVPVPVPVPCISSWACSVGRPDPHCGPAELSPVVVANTHISGSILERMHVPQYSGGNTAHSLETVAARVQIHMRLLRLLDAVWRCFITIMVTWLLDDGMAIQGPCLLWAFPLHPRPLTPRLTEAGTMWPMTELADLPHSRTLLCRLGLFVSWSLEPHYRD